MSLLRLALLLSAALLTSACATAQKKQRIDETLNAYRQAIRWGTVEDALAFVDPERLAERPYTALELDRYRQVAVSAYRDGEAVLGPDGRVRQTVGISIYNRHTMVERHLVDHQVWRWDAQAKRWWLVSGLPDLSQGQDPR